MRHGLITAAALIAFAANSLLCRMALAAHEIDPASFTAIRILSGACMLTFVTGGRSVGRGVWRTRFPDALLLTLYAAPFSYAYVSLGAGTGAFILFGAVQLSMISWGLMHGERVGASVWIGLVLALSGLYVLTSTQVSLAGFGRTGALWMVVAGVAWGAYSLRGRRGGADPTLQTAQNFVAAIPFAFVLLGIAVVGGAHLSLRGVVLSVLSGALASGLGYSLWYAALRSLTATRAALLQLLVPVIAAVVAMVMLGEPIGVRMAVGGGAILLGVGLATRR